MTENYCRLCFVEKSRSFGIFTTKGVKLNVANTIREHFPDEVNCANAIPLFQQLKFVITGQ